MSLIESVVASVQMTEALRPTAPAPNPASGLATVRFGTKEERRVTLALSDVLGRRIQVLYEGTYRPGRMQGVRLGAGAVPAGIYFLRLPAGGQTRAQRLAGVR